MKAKNAIDNINTTLGTGGPGMGVITIRPRSSPMLSNKGPNPRGVRNVNTKFIPGGCGDTMVSRILRMSGSSTVHANHRLTGCRKLLINVSSKTTITTTAHLTQLPRGRKGAVMTLLPSAKRQCLSALLCTFRRCPLWGWVFLPIVHSVGIRRIANE